MLLLLMLPLLAAAPKQLPSTVAWADPDDMFGIVPASAGKTPLERLGANRRFGFVVPAGEPLMMDLRLPIAASATWVKVTDAHREGDRFVIAIETRRYDGLPLDAAKLVTHTPIVEVQLGKLARGRYTVEVRERLMRYESANPDDATDAGAGFTTQVGLRVK